MKRRSGKYLNAREYAERLRLSDNKDVQDFAEEFLEALDAVEDSEFVAIQEVLDSYNDDFAGKTYLDKVKFLDGESDRLDAVEDEIRKACPEYGADMVIEDMVSEMLKRLRPVQEYDL
jgi:hypothetical protein